MAIHRVTDVPLAKGDDSPQHIKAQEGMGAMARLIGERFENEPPEFFVGALGAIAAWCEYKMGGEPELVQSMFDIGFKLRIKCRIEETWR